MRRAVHVLALAGVGALVASATPIGTIATDGTGTVTIGDRGRDGETGHTLVHEPDGAWWGELPAKQCGPVGFEPGTNVEHGLRLLFPLDTLPADSVITRATLALHDASPGTAGPIVLAGFVGAEPIGGDGPPDHTTGAIEIDPGSSGRRHSWNVTSVFSPDMVAFGWAGFWLRPVAGTEGLHDIDCPRDALFPILTIDYARGAAATAAPGTLVVGVGAEGWGRQKLADGDWADLTDSLCGDVGRRLDTDLEGTVVLHFPLKELPTGARITQVTLALHDEHPVGAAPIRIIAYDPFDPQNDLDWDTGEPAAPTGAIEIRPASPDARETWDVSDIVTTATIAHGWAGFLLRPADESDGMHHVACPGDPFYPILTIEYVTPADSSPVPMPTLPPTDTTPERGTIDDWGLAAILAAVLGVALWASVREGRLTPRT